MSPIAANLQAIRRRIFEALQGDSRAIRLVAVTKSQAPEAVRAAFAAGVRDFGESYVQEALPKIAALEGLEATWHYIGHLQTNKAREVASHFDWVHAIDRPKAAAALSRAREGAPRPLQVCIQVNISGEASKGGVAPGEALGLAREVAALPGLKLRGLMGMASLTGDVGSQREQFATLARTRREIEAAGIPLDTLSMGMSHDFEAALAEGATLVRIGTAIFGERKGRKAA
ncbi:MAG TPA: YggS family pyridoxal phosphate-dependent enzyme [Usitatibacter sp.]|nr:YggS family pyridoxal phosphate-dependent enzyme [Usitatibacter sp.]